MSTTIYVVEQSRWKTGDIAGCSVSPTGDVLHSHVSSSRSWLIADTTSNFGRGDDLRRTFGDFTVEFVSLDDPLPDAIAHVFGPVEQNAKQVTR